MQKGETVLFLHIPKVGGTTLNGIIYRQFNDNSGSSGEGGLFRSGIYYYPGQGTGGGFLKDPALPIPDDVRRALRREDLHAVVGHFWFGVHEHLTGPWRYITLLRDPVDRVVSLYYHFKFKSNRPPNLEAKMEQLRARLVRPADIVGMSLEEFVEDPPYREVDNDQTRRISGLEPPLGGCTRQTLEAARENLQAHFSVVGVTERFDETIVLMRHALNWTKDILYYPRNTNPLRPRLDAIPPSIRESILRRNELDHELYLLANSMLDEKISSMGGGFEEEVLEFRRRRQE